MAPFALHLLLACQTETTEADKAATDAHTTDAPATDKVEAPVPAAPPAYEWMLPQGLPRPPDVPEDNPMSDDKVALGHQLFMDPRLSVDGTRSCYSCHVNERGNADGRALALGAGDKPLPRNTPTIWNVAYLPELYWDGRADSLEKQATGAWKGPNMGVGDGLDAKAAEIGALPEYAPRFAAVFGLAEGTAVTPEHIVKAISAYERTLLCGGTAADKVELSDAARRGKTLFETEGRCVACHTPPLYTDKQYHDLGFGFDKKGQPIADADPGRGKHTSQESDIGKFRTPTLRNVAKTAPYFHDGRAATLEQAVQMMVAGGNPAAPNKDPLLAPTGLSKDQIADLVAFLESLTCASELNVLGDPLPVKLD